MENSPRGGDVMSDYILVHHGIKGQKWGVRRFQNPDGTRTDKGKKRYRSTSIRGAIAKRQNEKVDKGFRKWDQNATKRADAIDLGKTANQKRLAYEKDKLNKDLKRDYKSANKEYKKALRSNTTYRKGQIKSEVGKDLSRKHLSEAKKVKKQLDADPSNRQLAKQYNKLMNDYGVERARARRAPEVAANRSRRKAALKRKVTIGIKTAAIGTAVGVGVKTYNNYAEKNGKQTVNADNVKKAVNIGKEFMKYVNL